MNENLYSIIIFDCPPRDDCIVSPAIFDKELEYVLVQPEGSQLEGAHGQASVGQHGVRADQRYEISSGQLLDSLLRLHQIFDSLQVVVTDRQVERSVSTNITLAHRGPQGQQTLYHLGLGQLTGVVLYFIWPKSPNLYGPI